MMITMTLLKYAKLRGVKVQTALEECKEAEALIFEGSKILVDFKKVNTHLDNELIEALKNVKDLEVRTCS